MIRAHSVLHLLSVCCLFSQVDCTSSRDIWKGESHTDNKKIQKYILLPNVHRILKPSSKQNLGWFMNERFSRSEKDQFKIFSQKTLSLWKLRQEYILQRSLFYKLNK